MDRSAQPFWRPLSAGIALGLTLLLTFVLTGHGLGATGFFTRVSAWLGREVAPTLTRGNGYLGPMLAQPNLLGDWVTWQIVGVALGALAASLSAGRFRWQVEGAKKGAKKTRFGTRLVFAFAGGALAGFGARLAAGCTSGMGLSGSATLAVAGFLFLGGFFAVGLATSWIVRRVQA
jgi:uncharacterized membrane protein YedE/YeeE